MWTTPCNGCLHVPAPAAACGHFANRRPWRKLPGARSHGSQGAPTSSHQPMDAGQGLAEPHLTMCPLELGREVFGGHCSQPPRPPFLRPSPLPPGAAPDTLSKDPRTSQSLVPRKLRLRHPYPAPQGQKRCTRQGGRAVVAQRPCPGAQQPPLCFPAPGWRGAGTAGASVRVLGTRPRQRV